MNTARIQMHCEVCGCDYHPMVSPSQCEMLPRCLRCGNRGKVVGTTFPFEYYEGDWPVENLTRRQQSSHVPVEKDPLAWLLVSWEKHPDTKQPNEELSCQVILFVPANDDQPMVFQTVLRLQGRTARIFSPQEIALHIEVKCPDFEPVPAGKIGTFNVLQPRDDQRPHLRIKQKVGPL